MNFKKPKFWDDKKISFLSIILFPLTILITINNFILNFVSKEKSKKIKTICVGNIYVGGTGKTPLTIKLYNILKDLNYKVSTVKKFYKNQLDEQKILKNNGKLFLSSKRINAIKQAEKENFDYAILDDGLQDKTIIFDLSFVCFNNINWIGNGMTIPAGPLREKINNLKNYKHIFLNGNLENIDNLKKKIREINSNINIHLGKYEPINLNEFNKNKKYLVFSGIGNHKTFISMIKENGLEVLKDMEFSDHYAYTKQDIDKIINEASNLNCEIITTEKDYLRLKNFNESRIKIIKAELKIIDESKLIELIT